MRRTARCTAALARHAPTVNKADCADIPEFGTQTQNKKKTSKPQTHPNHSQVSSTRPSELSRGGFVFFPKYTFNV